MLILTQIHCEYVYLDKYLYYKSLSGKLVETKITPHVKN